MITATLLHYYLGACCDDFYAGIVFNNEMDDFSIPGASNAFGLAPFTTNYVEVT